jgi:hypothetical protein
MTGVEFSTKAGIFLFTTKTTMGIRVLSPRMEHETDHSQVNNKKYIMCVAHNLKHTSMA